MLRTALKVFAHGLALVVVSPLLLFYHIQALVLGRDRALEYASEWLALLPGLSGRYLRRAFLARVLAGGCHATASIGFGTLFSQTGAGIEANVYVGPRCHLGLVYLERDVLLAAGVHVTSGARRHGMAEVERPVRDQEGVVKLVRIGAGSWIGSNTVVMADVGHDTIVGAGAVVTKPLPDRVVAVGVPARVLHSREST